EKERDKISGVFIRRLQQGIKLQTDPSLIYGIYQKNREKITSLNKNQLKEDNAYNTYTRFGLPPTPIALPSKASIKAALNPDNSDYLYFVSDGKGGHIFSNEYQDHQKAVQQYRENQKKWRYLSA
ncbi:endolytic transglycosylase MltG, partial [Mesomycoplasma ovipneumoniae]|uniref:endolytic transglycosylase MltG n=1 Tax=Mesomycoplasma ovipneumoniae TaxID=29562 RepID=UPI0030807B79